MYVFSSVFFCIGTDRPALKYLNRHVRDDITGKWHDIGVELFDVEDESVLNTIMINHPGNTDQCTAKMLRLWLERKSDATWNQLIQALRAPSIKLEGLALKIERMLTKGHAHTRTHTHTLQTHTHTHTHYKHTHTHTHTHTLQTQHTHKHTHTHTRTLHTYYQTHNTHTECTHTQRQHKYTHYMHTYKHTTHT